MENRLQKGNTFLRWIVPYKILTFYGKLFLFSGIKVGFYVYCYAWHRTETNHYFMTNKIPPEYTN